MINNLNAIQKTVDYYHTLFLAENIGFSSLSKEDKELLKSRGYEPTTNKKYEDLLTLSYKFGKRASEGDTQFLKKLNYLEFSKFSKEKMTLTSEDKHVLADLKAHFYNDVKRAQNRVKDEIAKEMLRLNKDRRYYIRTKLKRKFTDKDLDITPQMLNDLSKYLGKQQKDWNNHFDLITSYRMHSTYQQGLASAMFEKYGNKVKVWFKVYDDACPVCKDTYLYTNGMPKIFYLLNVIKNGSNIGRRKNQILASVDPLHPRCRCTMQIVKSKIKKS